MAAYGVAAGLFALLVLLQAVLAGQFINGRPGLMSVHRALGAQVLPLLSIIVVVLAVMLRPGVSSPGFLTVPVALAVMTVLQTGLGFMGRDSAGAAGWHIPLGVAIFGLAVYNVALIRRLPAASR